MLDINNNGGIYLLKCLINNQCYVGSCDSFKGRKNLHYRKFKNNKMNKLIQPDYDKYGWDNFVFEIIEVINPRDFETVDEYDKYMSDRENYWIDKLETYYPKYKKGYNLRMAWRVGNKGRNNISNGNKGKKRTEEHKKNYSKSKIGRKKTKEELERWSKSVREKGIYAGSNNPRNTMNLEKAINIKEDIIVLRIKGIKWKEIELELANKYNTSPRMIERIRYGEHYLSPEIGGSYKEWID